MLNILVAFNIFEFRVLKNEVVLSHQRQIVYVIGEGVLFCQWSRGSVSWLSFFKREMNAHIFFQYIHKYQQIPLEFLNIIFFHNSFGAIVSSSTNKYSEHMGFISSI